MEVPAFAAPVLPPAVAAEAPAAVAAEAPAPLPAPPAAELEPLRAPVVSSRTLPRGSTPAAAGAVHVDPQGRPLADGWTMVTDPVDGAVYYEHEHEESRWVAPLRDA